MYQPVLDATGLLVKSPAFTSAVPVQTEIMSNRLLSVSVLLLLLLTGSVVPAGVATVAVLVMPPLVAVTVAAALIW